jgi:hypothetical protein
MVASQTGKIFNSRMQLWEHQQNPKMAIGDNWLGSWTSATLTQTEILEGVRRVFSKSSV